MFKTHACLTLALAVIAPAVLAQRQSNTTPPNNKVQIEHSLQRQSLHNDKTMELGDRQAARDALNNLTQLRAGLAEAWQRMGLSPAAARQVAAGYDPALASQMHHTSMRGKTDEQVSALLRSAVAANHYQVANQLLIDYQRQRLSLPEMAAGDSDRAAFGAQ